MENSGAWPVRENVGQLERAAYERAERDFARLPSQGYYFDWQAATEAVQFFSLLRHYKGRWAGQPFNLAPWQRFITAQVFGWKREDGTRRFRQAYVEVPRKNGKTTWAAGMGVKLLTHDREPGAEIYSSATKRDQARIVFDAAANMCRTSPELAPWVNVLTRNISCLQTNGKFEPLSADARTLDGLNPHGNIVDELHAHKDRRVWDVLDTAMGSREQPLTVAITTAGEYAPESIGWIEHSRAKGLLQGDFENDELFAYIAHAEEKDDIEDPKVWAKANPNLGDSLFSQYMESQVKKARETPSFMTSLLRYHFDIWVAAANAWLMPGIWAKGNLRVNPEELVRQKAWGGLDLSSVNDLTAFVLIFPAGDGMIDVLAFHWCPEERLTERANRDRVPYVEWARRGFIKTTPGNVIDEETIIADVIEICKHYDTQDIGFDRWGSKHIVGQLEAAGITVTEVGQGFGSLSAPSKELEKRINRGTIAHAGNPVLRWEAANVVTDENPAGDIKPVKGKSTGRIDGMVALIMALERWMAYRAGLRVYPSGGLMTVGGTR